MVFRVTERKYCGPVGWERMGRVHGKGVVEEG